jgi:hypothetical protein
MAGEGLRKTYTATCMLRRYQLLGLDDLASHESTEFDLFCKNHQIIPLYVPSHSSDNCNLLMLAACPPKEGICRGDAQHSK